jgi:hypothetical protein
MKSPAEDRRLFGIVNSSLSSDEVSTQLGQLQLVVCRFILKRDGARVLRGSSTR